MTIEEMMEILAETFYDMEGVRRVETFREAGLLTQDEGLVVTVGTGPFAPNAQFQITVVDSSGRL